MNIKQVFVNEPSPEAVDNWFRLYLRILCEKVWNRKYYSRTLEDCKRIRYRRGKNQNLG